MAGNGQFEGNLLAKPVSRVVKTGNGETQTVTDFSIMCDTRKQVNGEWVQDDEKTFAVDVTVWGNKRGEDIIRLLDVGRRVMVSGECYLRHFVPNEEQVARGFKPKTSLCLTASHVGLSMGRIKSLEGFPSRSAEYAAGAAGSALDEQAEGAPI